MFRIEHYSSITSTMDLARKRAENGEKEGLVIWADEISQAMGRLDRKWHADRGGLWISLLLRPQISPLQAGIFNYLSSVTACKALRSFGSYPISIKWPNDLLWESRKLGGTLVWARAGASQVEYLIWGIGINVNNVLPEQMEGVFQPPLVATSLKKEGIEICPEDLLGRLLNSLEQSYSEIKQKNFPLLEVQQEFQSHLSTLGKKVRIQISPEDFWEGKALGLDQTTGGLIVESQGKTRSFSAGDCLHLREQ